MIMEFVDVESFSTGMLEVGGIKQESESNTDTLALNENECQYNEYKLETKKEFDTNWPDGNKSYDDNYNTSQVLIENYNAQTLERYTDFVINGHFLKDFLSTEHSENIDKYEECPNCSKKFKIKGLGRHRLYCGKDADQKVCLACSRCEKKFNTKKALKKHEYYCNNQKYFHCNSCSFTTKHKNNLILHIESIHSSVYSITCPKCGKTLKNRKTLNVHVYYCGKEPSFQCTSCSYRTKYKRRLTSHSINIHSKDKDSIKTYNQVLNISSN